MVDADREVARKSFVKMAKLKAKMRKERFAKFGRRLAKQIHDTEKKVSAEDSKEGKDWLEYRLCLGIGDVKPEEAKGELLLSASFLSEAERAEKGFDEQHGMAITVQAETTQPNPPSEFLESLKQSIEEQQTEGAKTNFKAENGVLTITHLLLQGDPLSLFDLNLDRFLKDFSLRISSKYPLTAFFGEDEESKALTPAELAAFRIEFLLKLRKELFEALADFPHPSAAELLWVTFLEKFNLSLEFGDVKQLLDSLPGGLIGEIESAVSQEASRRAQLAMQMSLPPEVAGAAAGRQMQPVLGVARKLVMFLSDPSFKQTLREAVQTPAQMLDEASLKLAQAVRQNVKEIKSVSFSLASGLQLADHSRRPPAHPLPTALNPPPFCNCPSQHRLTVVLDCLCVQCALLR